MRIALISCTSKKKLYACKAAEMYSESPRFALAYKYSKQIADVVYILSAKYGLISEEDIIEPYDVTLNDKSVKERQVWSAHIIDSLNKICSLDNDEFIVIAGRRYNEFLLSALKKYRLPLEGQSLGRWIPQLKKLINSLGDNADKNSVSLFIHEWMNDLPRYFWNTIDEIPFSNGIYIMFETGERLYGMDRIVRIGTHKSNGRLKERLRDHFLKNNKDGSIFRKNIGLSLLHRASDSFENIWALNWSIPDIKNQFLGSENVERKKKIENDVSLYLRKKISFTCIQVEDKNDRLRVEEALIASLNKSNDFFSSPKWLGCYSPKSEIRCSGLWNTQGLNGNMLSYSEVESLKTNALNSMNNIYVRNNVKKNSVKIKSNSIRRTKVQQENLIVKKTSTSDIRNYINMILDQSKKDGYKYIDMISGEIHNQMFLSNKMPSVCNAMYQLMGVNDEVLHSTPSGKSSTIKIRYYLS